MLYAGTTEDMVIPQSKNAPLQSISREVDLAWLAGILDGEGCLELTLRKASNCKSYLMPKVRIYNTDIRMIEKASMIYRDNNLVFFYSIGNNGNKVSTRTGLRFKTQIGLCVASQGSTRKLLELVQPYLCNKRKIANIIIETIKFVQGCPKGGNTSYFDYQKTSTFSGLWEEYKSEKAFYIDPSTTKRRASEVISLGDMV